MSSATARVTQVRDAVAKPAITGAQIENLQRLSRRRKQMADESLIAASPHRPLPRQGTRFQIGQRSQRFSAIASAFRGTLAGIVGAELHRAPLMTPPYRCARNDRGCGRRTRQVGRLASRSSLSQRSSRRGWRDIHGSAALGGTKTPMPRLCTRRNQGCIAALSARLR